MKFLLLVDIFFVFALDFAYAPAPTYPEIVKGSYSTRNELLKAYFHEDIHTEIFQYFC